MLSPRRRLQRVGTVCDGRTFAATAAGPGHALRHFELQRNFETAPFLINNEALYFINNYYKNKNRPKSQRTMPTREEIRAKHKAAMAERLAARVSGRSSAASASRKRKVESFVPQHLLFFFVLLIVMGLPCET